MHIEVQVALNFVISYLYNKLPRRRVNLFGEELEKALKDKFQGHWYPEKPFKGSAFRCLKTGDPIDDALVRAARESGVPISDILENLPAELSVWVDPGEVSYRIGEKGAVKILFSEHHDHSDESSSADREVTKTFNPEAQCFRPIDAVNNSLNGLNLSPKTSPQGASPTSSTSPTYKNGTSPNVAANTFLPRTQAPITFTTATFAQTKFGSTKLKTSSKRATSSYRMSPTEFSNYIKQRAMQQQLHHSHANSQNHYGPNATSPSRSISPNPIGLNGFQNDPFYFSGNLNGGNGAAMNGYHQYGSGNSPNGSNTNNGIIGHHRNMFDAPNYHQHEAPLNGAMYNGIGQSKFASFMDPHNFYGLNNGQQQSQPPIQSNLGNSTISGGNINNNASPNNSTNNNPTNTSNAGINATNTNITSAPPAPISGAPTNGTTPTGNNSQQDSSKLIDGLQSFYSNSGPYQHLLVAN